MAEPTIQLGGGNWAGKSDNLLGYYQEDGRFYKQDFTFSRSTTGTYTDSDGYIQEMPYNKLLQSNTFDTSWSNSGTTETSGQSGYDGTNNAWLLEKSQSNAYIYQNITQSNTQTISVYAKSGSIGGIEILIDDSVNSSQNYNLDNGTLIGTGNNESSSIEDVGGGWYRCIITINDSATRIRFYPTTNTGDKSGTSGNIYIQNAQLNKGSSAKTYFPTTTRLDMPRVDYKDNTNGSLILEPQRTNTINYSNDYTQWSNTQFTINGNSVTSPEGITSGTKIVPSTSNSEKYLDKGGFVRTSGQYITHTVYAKASGYNFLYLSNSASRLYAVYDLQQGLVIYNNSNGTDFNNHSASIELFGNGWYKCELIGQAQSSFASYFRISCGITAINSSTQGLFQGDGTSGIEVYGSQVELNASYSTSYIPTSGSSVTRNADACTDGGDASRFNDSEGVLFFEGSTLVESGITRVISISDGSTSNNIYFNFNQNSNSFNCQVLSSGSNQFNPSVTMTKINNNKIALKYKENDFALWINGTEVATDTSGITPIGLDRLNFDFGQGSFDFEGKVKQIQYYNTALSDSELATLTTL